jgi:two-component system, LytTR family, sensor histidine kinase AlgZ
MHPILGSRRRLLLYVLAWAPILALLAFVTRATSGLTWRYAVVVLAPACVVYAFICLSSWYVCRAQPLRPASAVSLLLTFGMTASAAGLFLAGSAWGAAALLQQPAPSLPPIFGMGVLLYLLSVGLHYAALAAEASRESERREVEARALAREAELQSLRVQLNPHFLFNSLHSISALATQDGARARVMCIRLADFLRSSLGLGSQENIPLRDELALARSYLEVEQVRFGDRLRVEAEIEEACAGCAVPPLLLQPLVENAVKHGVAGLLEGGSIRLEARRQGNNVAITLENAFDPEAAPSGGMGIGLRHVRRRLQVRFGGQAAFEAEASGAVYRVSLRFPCESPITSSSRA